MDAVDGTDLDAGVVLDAAAGDDVGHGPQATNSVKPGWISPISEVRLDANVNDGWVGSGEVGGAVSSIHPAWGRFPTPYPGADAKSASAAGSLTVLRSGRSGSKHQIWFTRQKDAEVYAAGEYVNQGQAGDGLPTFMSPAENIDGKDVVAWYTASFSHHPHPEEFPTMSNERIRFRLAPHGFFDRYPALDVPDQRGGS